MCKTIKKTAKALFKCYVTYPNHSVYLVMFNLSMKKA